MNFKTPQEVFNHIISIYEKCDTLDEIDKTSDYFICYAIANLDINENLSGKCMDLVMSNFHLVNSDLRSNDVFLLSSEKARSENRQKEYIQIKIDYLKQLIELCDKESN